MNIVFVVIQAILMLYVDIYIDVAINFFANCHSVQISIFLPCRLSTGIVRVSLMCIFIVPPVHHIACLICFDVTTSNAQDRHHSMRSKS